MQNAQKAVIREMRRSSGGNHGQVQLCYRGLEHYRFDKEQQLSKKQAIRTVLEQQAMTQAMELSASEKMHVLAQVSRAHSLMFNEAARKVAEDDDREARLVYSTPGDMERAPTKRTCIDSISLSKSNAGLRQVMPDLQLLNNEVDRLVVLIGRFCGGSLMIF